MGLGVGNGILEVTHAFPFPDPQHTKHHSRQHPSDSIDAAADGGASGLDDMEGHEFQLEMMRMLREVNVDNNCVGWYQSMYLGIFSTSSLLENQLSYQTDLSPNAVVLLYDPMQTTNGKLVLKCFRLSDECLKLKRRNDNAFIDPKRIFEAVPVKLTNPGLARAFLADVQDRNSHNISSNTATFDSADGSSAALGASDDAGTFARLDLSTNPYLEKHLEFLCGWVDDLASEQHKFQYYGRQMARDKSKSMSSPEAPRRLEGLLIANQIRTYCEQVEDFSASGLTKLFVAGGLHKDSKSTSSTTSTTAGA